MPPTCRLHGIFFITIMQRVLNLLHRPVPQGAWWALGVLLFVAPILAVLLARRQFSYDEIPYLDSALRNLIAAPDKLAYLREEWSVPAGPVHALLYYVLLPVTGNDPMASRVVNLLMFFAVVAMVARILTREGYRPEKSWFASIAVLSIPPVWVLTGMALTEMPSLLLLSAVLLLIHLVMSAGKSETRPALTGRHAALMAVAGVCMGICVVGRQPYLLVVPLLVSLMIWKRFPVWLIIAFVVGAALAPSFVFGQWGGLVAPPARYSDRGIRVEHGILSVCYLGFFLLFLCPWFLLRTPWKLTAGAALVALGVNFFVLGFKRAFLETLATRFLPISPEHWQVLGGSVCVAMATATLVCFAHHAWGHRGDALYVISAVAILTLTGTAAAISHLFSSRYPAMALPFLVLVSMRHREWNALEYATTTVGAGLGAMVLWSYHVTTT